MKYNKPVVFKKLTIINQKGLHARPSATLVKTLNGFAADIYITKDDLTVNAKSIIGVMSLAAAEGQEITVKAVGPDAQDAVDTIKCLVKDKFGEE
jgi:phosphocarrier protein